MCEQDMKYIKVIESDCKVQKGLYKIFFFQELKAIDVSSLPMEKLKETISRLYS